MRDMLLNNIIFDMSKYINNYQLEKLKETINHHLYNLEVIKQDDSNILELDYNKLFLSSKNSMSSLIQEFNNISVFFHLLMIETSPLWVKFPFKTTIIMQSLYNSLILFILSY